MICIDNNIIHNQKALLLYGKTFVNYIYNTYGNINRLTKGLPSLPDIDINDDLINFIESNNSTIEQYSLYLYSNTLKDFGIWLSENINNGILTKRIVPNIYLTKEQETLLVENFDIDDILATSNEDLLNFANSYNGEQFDKDKLDKIDSILNNKLASTILLKKYYENPFTVNKNIGNLISNNKLGELANKNIIEKQC